MAPDADSDQTRAAQQRSEEQGEHAGVLARMEALYAQRSPLYSEVATLTVPTDGLSPQQVAALILVALGVQTAQAVSVLAPMADGQSASSTALGGVSGSAGRTRVRPAEAPGTRGGARRVRRPPERVGEV